MAWNRYPPCSELRGQTTLGAHALIAGVQYRYEKVDDRNVAVNGVFVNQLVKDSFDDLGLFVQDEWNLRDNLCIVLGGRVDCSSEVGSAIFSPRVGLWYSPGPSLVLRANVSTGFRAPALFSEGLHVDTLGGQPIRIRNDPSLKEESSVSYAVGFDWRPAFAGSAFSLEGQAYYTRITDTLFPGEIVEDADDTLFRTRTNQGGSTIMGGELTALLPRQRPAERIARHILCRCALRRTANHI